MHWQNILYDCLCAANDYQSSIFNIKQVQANPTKKPVISVARFPTQAEEETTKVEKFCFKRFYFAFQQNHCKLRYFECCAFYHNKERQSDEGQSL